MAYRCQQLRPRPNSFIPSARPSAHLPSRCSLPSGHYHHKRTSSLQAASNSSRSNWLHGHAASAVRVQHVSRVETPRHPGRHSRATPMSVACAASPEQSQVPEGVTFKLKEAQDASNSNDQLGSSEFEYDEESKTMKVPLSALEGGERRTRLVTFTCNKCGGRTTRAVNPIAWEKGMVYGQCGTCEVWHVLSAKNPKIYEEIRYNEEKE